jgi:N4-gp56 family major capsid protein
VSVTNLASVAGVTPSVWARRTLRDQLVRSFWGKLSGKPGSGAPLVQQFELLGGPGQILDIPTSTPIVGSGVSEESTLEGSEVVLNLDSLKVCPVYRRQAVRMGRLAAQRSAPDLMSEASFRLSEWGGSKLDSVRWSSFVASSLPSPLNAETYTPNTMFVDSPAADVDDLVAANKINVDFLRKVRIAMIEQEAVALRDSEGREYFGLALHPRQVYDLKQDTSLSTMIENAAPRGDANPVFTGAIGRLDGLVIYETPTVPVAVNANGVPCDVATAICWGAEAFIEGVAENPTWHGDTFDYASESGIAYGFSSHARRSLEKQSLLVYSSAVDPTA